MQDFQNMQQRGKQYRLLSLLCEFVPGFDIDMRRELCIEKTMLCTLSRMSQSTNLTLLSSTSWEKSCDFLASTTTTNAIVQYKQNGTHSRDHKPAPASSTILTRYEPRNPHPPVTIHRIPFNSVPDSALRNE
jgi:hypothetical protein